MCILVCIFTQVVLHLAAERVGHHEVDLPRSPPPAPAASTDIVEHEELEKMRGVLVHVRHDGMFFFVFTHTHRSGFTLSMQKSSAEGHLSPAW